MSNVIQLSDLNTTVNHEPRIQDKVLAERLGFEHHHRIKGLIERNIAELETYGTVSTEAVKTSAKGGRPSKTYYLNEGQCLVICSLSRTEYAAKVRKAIIEVYMAYRTGQIATPNLPANRLPFKQKPIDVKHIHELVEEVYCILGHFKMINQQFPTAPAQKKIRSMLLDAAERSLSGIDKEVIAYC